MPCGASWGHFGSVFFLGFLFWGAENGLSAFLRWLWHCESEVTTRMMASMADACVARWIYCFNIVCTPRIPFVINLNTLLVCYLYSFHGTASKVKNFYCGSNSARDLWPTSKYIEATKWWTGGSSQQ